MWTGLLFRLRNLSFSEFNQFITEHNITVIKKTPNKQTNKLHEMHEYVDRLVDLIWI